MTARVTMTVREAAEALDVHENTVRNWMETGRLRARLLPSGYRRPYASAVLALIVSAVETAPEADHLDALADSLERRAAALRRAAASIRESQLKEEA